MLKRGFRQLNQQSYQHIQNRSKRAQEHLEDMQQRGLNQGTMDGRYKEAKKAADLLAQAEYQFYLQKAKHKYFKEVDRNTPFFHLIVKRNNKRREIVAVEKRSGGITTKGEEVVQEFTEYFQAQLGVQQERSPFQGGCMQHGKTLTVEQQGQLTRMPLMKTSKKHSLT